MTGLILIALLLVAAVPCQGARSLIVEASGSACGKGASTEKTEQQALTRAMGQAQTLAADHVVQQLGLGGGAAEKEVRGFYAKAPIRGLQQLKSERYRNGAQRCVRIRIKAEVAPEEQDEGQLLRLTGDGPSSPLLVQVWPERQVYREGEKITFFVKGNKPFYGSIVYTDAASNIVQILPNRFHPEGTFEADRVYQLPAEEEFNIVVSPPDFGNERITVYAATVSLDELAEIVPIGLVDSAAGLTVSRAPKGPGAKAARAVEYVETSASLVTKAGR